MPSILTSKPKGTVPKGQSLSSFLEAGCHKYGYAMLSLEMNVLTNFLQSRWSAFVIALLSFSNVLLLSLLFYKLVPQLAVVPDSDATHAMITAIMRTTNADAGFVWSVDLSNNDRHVLAYQTRDEKDEPRVQEYLGLINAIRFTVSIPAGIVQSLIGGQSTCAEVDKTDLNPTPIARQVIQALKMTQVCFVPILNNSGALTGYVSVLWKNPVLADAQAAMMVQVQAIIREKAK
jgi:hypothetical protein